MGYIYNKKLNIFELTSKVKLSNINSYNIASNKNSKMLTIDSDNLVSVTDDARNLKVSFAGTGTGNTENDIKPNTEYTLSGFMNLVCKLMNNRYTKSEVDNLVSSGTTGLDWKQSVNTYNDILTSYPNPEDGWTVNVKDTDITYRYDGNNWIAISANSIPLATSSLDGKMSSADKTKLDGIATGANNYIHPTFTQRSSGMYKITVNSNGHVTGASPITKDDIVALGISPDGKNYEDFKGSTTDSAGESGLVPAPTKGASNRYLKCDGTWGTITVPTYNVATTTANGLMSSNDKTKLDGIATGATRVIVDSSLSSTSTNAIQNKIVTEAINNRSPLNHTHSTADINDFSSHTHTIAQITDMSNASVKYATTAGMANGVSWGNITNKPSLPTNLTNGTGEGSLIQNKATSATGIASKSLGIGTKATGYGQTVIGKYNVESGSTSSNTIDDLAFIIGGGTSDSERANAFSVSWKGNTNINGCYGTSGADYAEYFEWEDGNPNNEDRVGRFVTLNGDKILYATNRYQYIAGITSGNPSILGDSNDVEWSGKYEKDIFGRKKTRLVYDKEGKEFETYVISRKYELGRGYIPRAKRPEWIPVGLVGKIPVYDDGTCKPNSYCTVTSEGIATYLDRYSCQDISISKFYVLKRLSKNVVLVLLK